MPTTPRSSVFETPRIGVEALGASGTPVAASRQLGAVKWTMTPAVKTDTFGPSGSKYKTTGTMISEQTNLKGEGRPDYREIIYYLSSALTDPVITTPSGGTLARQWQWLLNSTSPDAQRTLSMESGSDSVRAAYVVNALLTDFTISADKQNAPKLSLGGFGNAWSDDHVRWLTITGVAGTFTVSITHSGGSVATTSAVAYNATAATLQTAIAALTNVGAGNVRVTGGPGGTAPYRIELLNTRADVVINAWTSVGSGGATAAMSRLYPSATALDVQTIASTQIDEFISATSFANLDTVMAANTIETDIANFNWGITGRNSPYFMLNTANGTGFSGTVEDEPKTTISFDVMSGPRSGYLNSILRSQTRLYMRFRAKGAFIETASSVDLYQQLLIDTCFNLTAPSEIKGIAGNVLGHTFTGEWMKDPTTGRAAIVTLMTDVTAF